MLSLSELREKIPASADCSGLVNELYVDMSARMDDLGLDMDDATALMLSNHILCLAKRIESGEFVDPIDEGLFSEVGEKARVASRACLEPAFERCGREVDMTELLMVATHVEVAMAKAAAAAGDAA